MATKTKTTLRGPQGDRPEEGMIDPGVYRVCVPLAPVVDKRGTQLVDGDGAPLFEPLAGFAGIHYPTDPEVIARIAAGEKVPMEERGPIKTVGPGEIADDIPAMSVPWLIDQGLIVPVEEGGD